MLEFDGTERSRVPVLPGQIDLAPLFPELWEQAPRSVLRLTEDVEELVRRAALVGV